MNRTETFVELTFKHENTNNECHPTSTSVSFDSSSMNDLLDRYGVAFVLALFSNEKRIVGHIVNT
jgi:hypothetical protein